MLSRVVKGQALVAHCCSVVQVLLPRAGARIAAARGGVAPTPVWGCASFTSAPPSSLEAAHAVQLHATKWLRDPSGPHVWGGAVEAGALPLEVGITSGGGRVLGPAETLMSDNGMPGQLALALMQVGWGGGGEWEWKEDRDANGFPLPTAALYPGCYHPPCPFSPSHMPHTTSQPSAPFTPAPCCLPALCTVQTCPTLPPSTLHRSHLPHTASQHSAPLTPAPCCLPA